MWCDLWSLVCRGAVHRFSLRTRIRLFWSGLNILSGLATISSKRLAQLGYFRSEKQKRQQFNALLQWKLSMFIYLLKNIHIHMTQCWSSLAKVAAKSPQRKKRPPNEQVIVDRSRGCWSWKKYIYLYRYIDKTLDNSAQNWSHNVRSMAKIKLVDTLTAKVLITRSGCLPNFLDH